MLPGSAVKPGLSSFPFFMVLRIPFLLVRLAYMDALTSPWHRPTTTPPLDCPSPHLYEGARTKPKSGFWFNAQKVPCKSVVVSPWQWSLTFIPSLMVIRVAGSQLGVHLPVPLTLGRREPWSTSFMMCYSLQFHHHHLHVLCRLVLFLNSWINGEALLLVGLWIWWRVTIFNLGVILIILYFHWV